MGNKRTPVQQHAKDPQPRGSDTGIQPRLLAQVGDLAIEAHFTVDLEKHENRSFIQQSGGMADSFGNSLKILIKADQEMSLGMTSQIGKESSRSGSSLQR